MVKTFSSQNSRDFESMSPEETDNISDRDDPNIDPEELKEELKYSRQVLAVVESDDRLFEEHARAYHSQHSKDISNLLAKKELAEASIRGCQNSDLDFLRDMFVRFDRSYKEALAMQRSDLQHVKNVLKKKVMYNLRYLDLKTFRRLGTKKFQIANDFDRSQVQNVLNDRKNSGDISFRTNITNHILRRLARETRELIQGFNSTMVYMDMVGDVGKKFSKIKEYIDDDAGRFEKSLLDLQEKIRSQQKEMIYLASVFKEATKAKARAEKVFAGTGTEVEKAEAVKEAMLQDLQNALQEHRDICNNCVEQLIAINDGIRSSADSCFVDCEETVKPYPHGIMRVKGHPQSKRKHESSLACRTEMDRTYEILQEITKASDPQELKKVFGEQVKQATIMDATAAQLGHLLKTVLRPEFDMFTKEREMVEAEASNRHDSIEKSIADLQNEFDEIAERARGIVSQQRDNIEEFKHFTEILQTINIRIGKLAGTTLDDEELATACPGVEGLLDLVEKNIKLIAGRLPDYFRRDWDTMKEVVNDSEFLKYRASKLPSSNNRITFEAVNERPESPVFNPKFVTNAQFKQANEQILERARQAEAARLRAADLESARAQEHDTKAQRKEKEHDKGRSSSTKKK